MLRKITNQLLLSNSVRHVSLGRESVLNALIFAHAGGSDAVVEVFAVPLIRPDSTKSNFKIYHATVAAGTTQTFQIHDLEIDMSIYRLEVETDSAGAGNIQLTVLGM
mgnify:CR=1 FL=1